MTIASSAGGPDPRRVFVIHGRNDLARTALFDFLRSIGLAPIEWSQAIALTGQASPYIGDVLDRAFAAAQAVVVLETPDDIAYLHPSLTYADDPECDAQPQPRPNVLFEAGMAMGRNPDRTIIVEFGQVKVFSDIHGRHVVRLDNSIGKRQDLASRLQTAGCTVDISGHDWHRAGDLTPPPPPGGGLPMGRKLPRSKTAATPQLDGRYIDRGRNKIDAIEIINHGPGDVFELDVEKPEGPRGPIRDDGILPVPKLPQGKSITIDYLNNHWGGARSHLTIVVTGKTVEGTPIRAELFVSIGA